MKKYAFTFLIVITVLFVFVSCKNNQTTEKTDVPSPKKEQSKVKPKKESGKLLQIGQKIHQQAYTDIFAKSIPFYGLANQQTLVMFSFIGCAGCEVAMRKMKQKNYKLKEGIRLFYSSGQDNSTALQAYLEKKEFPFSAFSKKSLMHEDFPAFVFPTFVLIDSEGVIQKVAMGYNEEVEKLLFD